MPQLALFLLGSPRIERNGAPVDIDRRKALALLAYLALTRQRHRRDALATLLWPDQDQTHARGALRRILTTLNNVLGNDELETDRETIGLRQDTALWIDVEQFQHLIDMTQTHRHAEIDVCADCLDSLSKAVALYR